MKRASTRQIYVLIIILATLGTNTFSQVTIGSGGEPVNGALLQLKENENKGINSENGLVLPRVSLKSPYILKIGNKDFSAMEVENTGLIVYNLDNQCISTGVYTWTGKRWVPLYSAGDMQKDDESPGNFDSDIAALKKFSEANGNKTGWSFSENIIPENITDNTFPGVTWSTPQCESKKRVVGISLVKKNLTSAEGIKDLLALKTLTLNENKLTNLDISTNKELTQLNCYKNSLIALDVSNNTELVRIYCSYNSLSSLNLSNNPKLAILWCSDNKITEMNLSRNIALNEIHLYNNQLITIDLPDNSTLTSLHIYRNKLSTLSLKNNRELKELVCYDNQITLIDGFTSSKKLARFQCQVNKLNQSNTDAIVEHLKSFIPNICSLIGTDLLKTKFIINPQNGNYNTLPCP